MLPAPTLPFGFTRTYVRRCWSAARAAGCLVLALAGAALPRAAAAAAEADPPMRLRLSEYQKQNWQVEDGLSESMVRQITQAPDGRLLLATFSGVLTFDGQRFAPVDIMPKSDEVNGSAVNAILPGLDGDLWVGTDGIGVLHQTGREVVNVSEAAGFLHERIRTMAIDRQGVLWVATHNGIERFRHGRLERLPGTSTIGGDITTIFAEGREVGGHATSMMFVTSGGLFRWTGSALQAVPLAASYGAPTALYRDRDGKLWVGTEHAVLQVNEEHGAVAAVQQVVRTGSPVTVLVGDAGHNLWVGTRHDGMWRYSPGDGRSTDVSHWTSRDGFEDETVRSLYVDDEDNLWIGMLSGGLSRWRKAAFAPYGRQEGLPISYASATYADSRGDLWLGTWGQGLFRRRGDVVRAVPLPEMQPSTPVRALTEGKPGEMWVGTWFDGVYRISQAGVRHFRLGIESPVNAVSALLFTRDGALWVGTYTGIFHFPSGEPDGAGKAGSGTVGTGSSPGERLLGNHLITCLLQDENGDVLVGTSDGLFRVHGGQAVPLTGLAHPYVLSLFHDLAGNAWVGARSGGLGLVQGSRVARLLVDGKLGSLPIYSGVEDRDGHLWLGTSRGILRASRRQMQMAFGRDRSVMDVMLFGKSDGMRSSDTSGPSQPTATRMADGTLWFATTRGFVHTTAVAEDAGPRIPVASIEGWSLAATGDDDRLESGGELNLKPGQADVRIFFDARELSNPGRIEFRYRLEGYDSDWTTTHARVAHYKHLSAGSYRFIVQARKGGTEWISAPATLPVVQRPHVYTSWWFVLAMLVLAGTIAWIWYQRRIARMRASLAVIVEERNRIARECHDTLMAGFAAVAWQVEATAKRLADGADKAAVAQSCELAHSMVLHCQAEARRIIWDLRDSDEISGVLSHALSRAIDAHYREHSIQVSLNVDGPEMTLPPNSVHHLVCIGQEAISNALRHASPKRIDVRLAFARNEVRLQVLDDGCGFQPGRNSGKKGHFGLMVMEERARKLGGDFQVGPAPRGGTEVVVRVPFSPGESTVVKPGNALSAGMW